MIAFLFYLIVFIVFVVVFPIYLFREMKAQKQLRMPLETESDCIESLEVDSAHYLDENSIAFYEIQIEQLKELSRMYQAELDRTTDTKRKRTLLARCISLDKQTYNAQRKLDKLKEDV